MKIIIGTPALWFSKRDLISWFLVGCLRRRKLAANPTDFDFVSERGLTMMDVRSGECSRDERLAIQDCVLRLSAVLSDSALAEQGEHTLLDELREFSGEDRKELEEYENLFRIWLDELEAAKKTKSKM